MIEEVSNEKDGKIDSKDKEDGTDKEKNEPENEAMASIEEFFNM